VFHPSLEHAMPRSSSSFLPTFSVSSDSKNAMSISILSSFASAAGRKFRIRTSLVALLALCILSMFCILHQHLNDTPTKTIGRPRKTVNPTVPNTSHRSAKPARLPQITLSPEDELAALIAFMDALPSNALPELVNVSAVDPDLILDFDTRSSKAVDELHQLVDTTWKRLPIVVLSKRYPPTGREIKTILSEFNLRPSPVIFDINERADDAVISLILTRLTAQTDFPILLFAGKPVGSIATIQEFHKSGQLREMIAATGAIIDGARKKLQRGVAAR